MTDQGISPLHRRMLEDMAIRKLAPKTHRDHVQRVKDFATFLSRSPTRLNRRRCAAFGCIWRRAAQAQSRAPVGSAIHAFQFFSICRHRILRRRVMASSAVAASSIATITNTEVQLPVTCLRNAAAGPPKIEPTPCAT
jgi:hypothetical protein